MYRGEAVKEEFLGIINKRVEELKKSAKILMEEDRRDEAKFEKVKLNVYEIFEKMFLISFKSAYRDGSNTSSDDKDYYLLEEEYNKFFEKITKPWKDNAVKDKEHGLSNDLMIEEIKIETAEEIKSTFKDIHQKYK